MSAKIEKLCNGMLKHGIELYKGAYNIQKKLEMVTIYNLPSLSTGEDITEDG